MMQKKGKEENAVFKKEGKYFRLGLTLLTVIILSILFYITLENVGTVFGAIKQVLSLFSFVFYGIAFAYLMNPIQKLVEKGLKKLFGRRNVTERGLHKLSRTVSVIVALLSFLAILYGLIAMVVPQLVESLTETFSQENLQNYYDKITTWLNNVVRGTPVEDWLQERDPVKAVQDWVTKEINIFSTLGNAVNEVYGVAKVLFNMIIGIVAAVYLLISKEKFIAQTKKIIVSVFRPKTADRLFEIGRLTNRSFGGFIVGKLIDSLIIGILSYIGMIILGLPYPLLSSALVGIFNIIPFFGPLIGIVPAALLILLQSPIQCLYFLIFEIILQQVDANIIGPRILGGRLGISEFWILVSITILGGVFGFPGMILGVPAFTVFYTLISQAVRNALKKKTLPVETDEYYPILTVEDLKEHDREFGEAAVFYSEDNYETEYDPDDDFEFDDPGA
jgi:predicted PurR-regulated permease PerM